MRDNQDVNYSLISAVREGRLETARELINSFGLCYSQAWSEGYVLLCDALQNKHTAVAKLLLTSGSKVNSKKKNPSNTPLHFAVINGDIEIVKMILDKGANINAKNQYGLTALDNAIENKKMEVTELLIKHTADVNARDYGRSLLHVAAEIGCLEIVEHLLKYGAYVNCVCTSRWKKGYVPLHFAVESGSREVVTLLLSRGANVDVKGEDGITPLHIAAKKGYIHIAEDLLNHGACTHSVTLKEGYTPLHFASRPGNEAAVKLFLNKGADVNARDYGRSLLHVAAEIGCLQIVEHLLKYGAYVNSVCTSRWKEGYIPDVVNGNLLKYGAYVNCVCTSTWKEGYIPDVVNGNLLKLGAYVNSVCTSSWKKGYVPLHFAVENGSKEVVMLLLSRGANVDVKGENDITSLHIAAKKGYIHIAEDLLNHGACTHSFTLKEGYMPLHFASERGNEEAVKFFLNNGADINASTNGNLTPLHIAIKRGRKEVVKLLLQHGAKVDNQDKDGKTTLHLAVEKGNLTIVEEVLKYCPDINDQSNRSSLKSAVHGYGEEYKKIIEALLEYGLVVNPEDANNPKLLHAAVEKGYLKIIEDLLKYGADVNTVYNSKYEKGFTPLHSAAKYKQKEVAKLLISYEADVNAQDKTGKTPIFYAIENEELDITKVLLECGAKVDSKMESDITPLHFGAQKGYQEIIETILKFGANIDSRDAFGRTALHFASEEGHVQVVFTLLKYGANINITSINNCTPLDHAMAGTRSVYYSSDDDDGYYDPDGLGVFSREIIAVALLRHIVKMKTANLYLSEENLLSISSRGKIRDFQDKCEEEIASMKNEKINNSNISFYDILAKGTSSLAIYMRNENIVQVLKSNHCKTKFPIYASMIESHFREGMKRKELLEQRNKIFHFLFNNFPELPCVCTEKIFSYLSDKDLKNFDECL